MINLDKRFYDYKLSERIKNQECLKFIVSQKDKIVLLNDGYIHLFYKKGVGKSIWLVLSRKKYKCTTCYTTKQQEIGHYYEYIISSN